MHLVYPTKFCITTVSNFTRVLQSSQEKSKTMVMQAFGGVNRVHYSLVANDVVEERNAKKYFHIS